MNESSTTPFKNNNIIYEEERKCHMCGINSKDILKDFKFEECKHFYCVYCLFRTLFNNSLKEIIEENETIIKCKCKKGKKKLSLNEIDKIVKDKSKLDEEKKENYNQYCKIHKEYCELFCKDCEKYICLHCKNESEHKNHKIVLITIYVRMYKEFIKGMPLRFKYAENFKLQLDKSVDKFSKELAERTNSVIKGIIQMIEELTKIKNNYLSKLKEIQENGLESINLMKSFYFEYYHDLSNLENDNDIFSLRYLARLKSELNNFEMRYAMGIFNKLEEIQKQIKSFKSLTENPFSLKVNYKDIPTTFREVTRTLGHDGPINCLSKIGDNQFISGSLDNTIKFWNLDDEELKPYDKIDKYTGKVGYILLLKDNHLCSSSVDENWVKIYEKIKTFHENNNEMVSDYQYNVLVTLSEHKKPISSIIELDNNLLVTGARDGFIIIWESIGKIIKKYQQLEVCKEGVYSLCKLNDGKFASGGADGIIKLFKLDSLSQEGKNYYFCYQTLNHNEQKIRCLVLLNNNNLCSGDDEGNLAVFKKIDDENYELFWSQKIEDEIITCLAGLRQGYIISGSFNQKNMNQTFLRVWEPTGNGYERKETIRKHYKTIKSVIELDWGNIVSAGDDGVIIIWKSGVLVD